MMEEAVRDGVKVETMRKSISFSGPDILNSVVHIHGQERDRAYSPTYCS